MRTWKSIQASVDGASGFVFAAGLTEGVIKRLFFFEGCVIVATEPEPVAVEAEQGRWVFLNALTGMFFFFFFVNSCFKIRVW